ncbi:MAG: hypothetical protein WC890_01325 [Candidatus Margulisiibacteriota bacterium]
MQNVASQAAAVVSAEGATVSIANELRQIDKFQKNEGVEHKDLMTKVLESSSNKEASTQILRDLLAKVASAGIMSEGVAPKAKVDNRSDKKENSSRLKQGDFSDQVEISLSKSNEIALPVKALNQGKGNFEQQTKAKWEVIKEKMIKEGKSTQEISYMEQQYKTSETQKNMVGLLKDAAILYYLDSDTKLSQLVRRRGFAELMKKAGKELGQQAAQEARSEVQGMVMHELENQLIARTFLQDNDFKACHRLIQVGEKVGFKAEKWMDDVWPQKKEDHGLYLLDIPHEATGSVDLKDNDPNSRRQKAQFDYNEKDEKDLALNRLRAAYMQMALCPGAIDKVKTWFKVCKLRGGLIRLSIYTRDVDSRLQEEARTLAKVKSMEMLEEALQERASFFDEGPAKNLVDDKIKNIMKNLQRLGFELRPEEFVALKDKANQDMYGLAQREMENARFEKGPKVAEKIAMLNKLITKLQKETNLGVKEEA